MDELRCCVISASSVLHPHHICALNFQRTIRQIKQQQSYLKVKLNDLLGLAHLSHGTSSKSSQFFGKDKSKQFGNIAVFPSPNHSILNAPTSFDDERSGNFQIDQSEQQEHHLPL